MKNNTSAAPIDALTVLIAKEEHTKPGGHYGPVIRSMYIIECCTGGFGTITINNTTFPVSAGDCYVLLPGDIVTHTSDAKDPRVGYWCALGSPFIGKLFENAGISSVTPFANPAVFQEALNWMQQLVLLWPKTDIGAQIQQIGCAYGLFGTIIQGKQSTARSTMIDRAIGLMETNYPSPLSVADIAQAAGFEECYFSVLFKKKTGFSPYKYLTKLRIQKACKLMLSGGYSLAEIAQLVGLDEHNFSRIFKREIGTTPTQYLTQTAKNNLPG